MLKLPLKFQAALRVDKYHIALRHLKRIRDVRLINGYVNEEGQNLLHILALATTPGTDTALQLKVPGTSCSKHR